MVKHTPFKRVELAGLVVVAGVVLYVYRGAFSGFFIQDDFGWLLDSRFRSLGEYLSCFFRFNPAGGYRPLSQETFFFVGQVLFGMQPAGFHVLSFAFHLLGTVVLYFLLRQFFPPLASLTGTVFYGIHSAHMSSVYWISAVAEPMASACYAVSLLFFVRFDRTGRTRFFVFSMIGAIVGIMSKESILSLPLAIAVYTLIFSRRRWKWASAYFALPAAYVLCRFFSMAGASPYPLVFGREILQNLCAYMAWTAGFSEALLKLKLQWQLGPNYLWIALGFLLTAVCMVWFSGGRKTGLFAAAWFVFALQPVLYFHQHIFAYYLAPALLAVSFLIASAVAGSEHRKWVYGAGVAAVVVLCTGWAAEFSVRMEGKWWTERSFISRGILRQMPGVARQVPSGHMALMFGFGREEFGVMQNDAAFKAYGFSPSRFILVGLDERTIYNIETLRVRGGLGSYECFLYSNGVIANRTLEFRQEPRAFYAIPKPEFIRHPEVKLEVNLFELVAGKDTLRVRVLNLGAPSIDVLYKLDDELLPPILNWRLDKNHSVSLPLDKSTPRGVYHWIGIRGASTRDLNKWIPIDVRITIR